jgi:glycosyltransferase involved in cell wall biosynthesis
MNVAHPVLFNFSASPVGGGLKRATEYAKWFDRQGGAWFMVHERCRHLVEEFPRNRFFVIKQSPLARVIDDLSSVRRTLAELNATPECYYAFGIPLYARVGRVNWFHLSNVLPLDWRRIPLPVRSRIRFRLIGHRIKKGLPYADVISAESNASVALFDAGYRDRLFLSVNGNDDELREAERANTTERRPRAVVVGTYPHKDLDESCAVFDTLKKGDPRLTLVVFGDSRLISRAIKSRPDVVVRGSRPRSEVIEELLHAQYYISTTRIEGSSNAASEGIFLAKEAFLSDIGPHRELLADVNHHRVTLTASGRPMLHIHRHDVSTSRLKTWSQVIGDMMTKIDQLLRAPNDALPVAVQSSAGRAATHV